MNKDFELFKSEFLKWQVKFGLTGYCIWFNCEPMEELAGLQVDQNHMTATVGLNSEPKDRDKPLDIKELAKHECLHLLVGRLMFLAKARYLGGEEIPEAVEELVNKLEGLIPDG